MDPPALRALALAFIGILLLAAPAGAAEAEPAGLEELARALELEESLDARSRRLALELGQSQAFTQAPGRALRREGLLKLLAVYRRVLAANPDNAPAQAGLARVLAALTRFGEAMAAYHRALELMPGDARLAAELAALERLRAPSASLLVSAGRQREYWPPAGRHLHAVVERSAQLSLRAPLGDTAWFGAGWLEGSIEQHSLVFGDNDYVLKRRAPFLHLETPLIPGLTARARLRREVFSIDNQESYYQAQGQEVLWTGYALLEHQAQGWWLNASLSRERDTWPELDASGRGVLRIGPQELWGLSAGLALAPGWEAAGSLFYETYSSSRPEQLNANLQLIHRPSRLPDLRLALGAGHYSEESESLLNLQVGYQLRPLAGLACELTYQAEYLKKERSLLSQVDALVSWQAAARLALTLRASWGSESGDDRDEFYALDLGVSVSF